MSSNYANQTQELPLALITYAIIWSTRRRGDWLGLRTKLIRSFPRLLARAKHKCVNWYRNKSRRGASETISAVWFHQSASQHPNGKGVEQKRKEDALESGSLILIRILPASQLEKWVCLGAHTLCEQTIVTIMHALLLLSFECARRHPREKRHSASWQK